MHRVDLARAADEALWAMPDDVHEETLALIDDVADDRECGVGPMVAADAVLRGRYSWWCSTRAGLADRGRQAGASVASCL